MRKSFFILAIVTFAMIANVNLSAQFQDLDNDGWWDIRNYNDLVTLSSFAGYWNVFNHYELTNNIYVPSGTNFSPIGNASMPFRGSFRGKDPNNNIQYMLVGLIIERPNNDAVGLFGVNMGLITNLVLCNFDIWGKNQIGALCGLNEGYISSCQFYFDIANNNFNETYVSGDTLVGGLVGANGGTIVNCLSTQTKLPQYTYVSVIGNNAVGGFVGGNTIIDTNSMDNNEIFNAVVTNGYFPNNIGGFSGYNDGTISNCKVGGYTEIWDSMNGLRFGGFVGNNNDGTITNCQVGDSVIVGTNDRYTSYTGGFAGKNTGDISFSSAGALIYAKSFIGGFVGLDSGHVSDCRSSSMINAKLGTYGAADNVGGFVGCDKGLIQRCYVDKGVVINAPFSNWVGGFTGRNVGEIEYSCAKDTFLLGHNSLGGFMGACFGTVHDCYSRGEIHTVFRNVGDSIGGFVGVLEPSGSVERCYSTTSRIDGTAPGAFAQYWDFGWWDACDYDLRCNRPYYGIGYGWTTNDMKISLWPYQYWDFTNIWEFDANQNDGYPSFRLVPNYKVNYAKNEKNIEIYPNPVSEVSTINITKPERGLTTIAVYSISGEKVENLYSGELTDNENSFNFNGSNYSSGMYYLVLETINNRIVKPIVVQH
ncbi:MAG: T9SS type A sorting domain-containing protein [bacterium]